MVELALESGAHALRFFSKYFNIPYPGEKLDMVAIPDFAFGAMENLGLVTYRETALLVDPKTASHMEMERVASVVDHEIAHMWFGDLVTMEWWEGIWLNEAFATFMQTLCSNDFRPQWEVWVGFGAERDAAMQIDGLHSTRPIEYEVLSPDDTRGMFDILTYEKGGSVLRMIEQWLTPDVFRDGIRAYLKKHSYANTITTDLWDALEESSGLPVRDVANSFILQGGHPLVTFADGELRQQPFAYAPSKGQSSIGDVWQVPVLTRSLSANTQSSRVLGAEVVSVPDAGPVVVNAGGSGVFRTRYGQTELAALSSHIGDLTKLERFTLVADSWATLYAGEISWNDFLATARGLVGIFEPLPWGVVADAFGWANRALTEAQKPALAAQATELFGPIFAELGWSAKDGEDELTPQLRAHAIGALGLIAKDADVQAEAVRLFEANTLDGDLARTILRIVASANTPGAYETFLARYKSAASPQEEQRYMISLGGFSDETIALDAAEKAFSDFRNQDSAILLGVLSMNATTGPKVWEYFTSRWDEAMEKFPLNTHSRLAMGIPTYINDEAFADKVEAFHTSHPLGGEQRTIEQLIERMRVGIAFSKALRSQF
jgi:puromycin-sensitive aminopeptidase